jgi:hypothetical protein
VVFMYFVAFVQASPHASVHVVDPINIPSCTPSLAPALTDDDAALMLRNYPPPEIGGTCQIARRGNVMERMIPPCLRLDTLKNGIW